MNKLLLIAALAGLLPGCAGAGPRETGPRVLEMVASWSGDYPVNALDRLPEEQRDTPLGWLDETHFTAVWASFQPGVAAPRIDFTRDLVVFVRNTEFYNRTRIGQVTLTGGVAEVLAMETMSATPIEDRVAMALAVVPRAGIRTLLLGDTRIPVASSR